MEGGGGAHKVVKGQFQAEKSYQLKALNLD